MAGKYDDLVRRIVSGGDVSREEMRQVHTALEEANDADQPYLWYIIELYDSYGYSLHGKATTTDPHLELLARAKVGLPITDEEIAEVAEDLEREMVSSDSGGGIPGGAYMLLHIIGKHGDTRYSPIVERFLDPRLSAQWGGQFIRMALWILCRWWGMASQYSSHILYFMQLRDWDYTDEARIAAIGVAGEHLGHARSPALLKELIRIVEDASESSQIRARAAAALMEAMGYKDEYSAWLPTWNVSDVDLDLLVDPEIMTEAKLRLRREQAN